MTRMVWHADMCPAAQQGQLGATCRCGFAEQLAARQRPTRHEYLTPGTMTRVEGGWCGPCAVSSIWTGSVYRLSDDGARPVGTVTGCEQCGDWCYDYPRGHDA